jgi:hypothetical protein
MTKIMINNMNMTKKTFSRGDMWDVHGSGLAGETPLFWFKSLFLSFGGRKGEINQW